MIYKSERAENTFESFLLQKGGVRTLRKVASEKTKLLLFNNQLAFIHDIKTLSQCLEPLLEELFEIKVFLITVSKTYREIFCHYLTEDIKIGKEKQFWKGNEILVRSKALPGVEQYHIINNSKGKHTELVAETIKISNEVIGELWFPTNVVSKSMHVDLAHQLAITLLNIALIEKRGVVSGNNQSFPQPSDLLIFKEIKAPDPIIGKSGAMVEIIDLLNQISTTSTTILISGETGTGKEVIARWIHYKSTRRNQPFVKINCAVLHRDLIESELFGHEEGAFTGATQRRVGKFEMADKGTILLDGISELPMELQSKLLRVLQEREIERLGSNFSIKVDVRIIAITNQNLTTEMLNGRFREDLFYRLNAFSLCVPPLRDRKNDIPLLVDYFLRVYSTNMEKNIRHLQKELLKKMMQYNWPGNVRELECAIEREVLLAKSDTITNVQFLQNSLTARTNENSIKQSKTASEAEREHYLLVLKQCNGKVAGLFGAAEILNLPVSTLNSRLKKLGIQKKIFAEASTKNKNE
jgi:transcriptional regulator with GAF, ATPase, and Fis domain